ncbi:hypothetical protein [Nonomuraea sp. LPB2021202275-12-8]|uniref:hypothetical protein n=1 Tax=Nonomuraea sp. LPB2021202275-12-8 TaxID=3120159 RepID=UPI00300CAAC8
MGAILIRTSTVATVTLALSAVCLGTPAHADDDKLFTFKDSRITESSGLAVSPTHDGVYYTHNDSSAQPEFYAVGQDGRTRATFRLRGAEARDWEAMAVSKDPATGRATLWLADIGDNLDSAWPDISIYKVNEPADLADATLPATRYRFRYAGGGRNAEGVMVNPVTGRLYVVSKELSGAVYAAPKKLRTGRPNVLRKIASAPIMATDAAYAPDGSSYVVRTYFSATLYRPSGELIGRVPMPDLQQAESIAYTLDGKALLAGSEGPSSPVYRVPLPATALSSAPPATPARSEPPARPTAQGTRAAEPITEPASLTGRDILIWLAAAAIAIGAITFLARRTR